MVQETLYYWQVTATQDGVTMRKISLLVLTAASITVLFAADAEESKKAAPKKKADSVEVTINSSHNSSQQSLQKSRRVDPGKTNWSKIKNLFL